MKNIAKMKVDGMTLQDLQRPPRVESPEVERPSREVPVREPSSSRDLKDIRDYKERKDQKDNRENRENRENRSIGNIEIKGTRKIL